MEHSSSLSPQSPQLSGRNADIEMFRFLAAVAVLMFHLHLWSGGLLAVDFFYILSGALMTRSLVFSKRASSASGVDLTDFFFRKLKSFYPELLAAVIIGMLASVAKDDPSTYLHRCYFALVNEVCLLRMTALSSDPTMGSCPQSWYLSSMMIAGVIVFPVIKYVRKPALIFVAGCMICGYLVQCAHGLQGASNCDWYAITYSGNIRAVGDMLLGSASLYAAEYLKNTEFSALMRTVITMVKYLAMSVALLMFVVRYRPTEAFVLLLCMCIVSCCFSNKDRSINNAVWHRICLFLGKVSLPLYLAHWPIVRLFPKLEGMEMPGKYYLTYPILLLVLTLLIYMVYFIACCLRKLARRFCL